MAITPLGYRVDTDIAVRLYDNDKSIVAIEDADSIVNVRASAIPDLIEALQQVVRDAQQ